MPLTSRIRPLLSHCLNNQCVHRLCSTSPPLSAAYINKRPVALSISVALPFSTSRDITAPPSPPPRGDKDFVMTRLLLIVTGASRGLGRAIATAFVKNETPTPLEHVRVLLLARSVEGLIETESLIKAAAKRSNVIVDVSIHVVDLSDLPHLEECIRGIFSCVYNKAQFSRAVLINNAASLGHLGLACTMPSLRDLQRTIDFNVTSTVWLSSRFVRDFAVRGVDVAAQNGNGGGELPRCTVVNISSLCALHPFKTMGVYCTGKVAREMFHAVLAQEEGNGISNVKVLNYAPGACQTDMSSELSNSDQLDHEMKDFFRKAREENSYVKLDDTSRRLVNCVLSDEFESGAHIDYWDLVNAEAL